MKRFTIIFSILLALGFGAVLAYVAASPEFVPPSQLIGEGEDPDAPIWDMTMDEVLAELEGQGLIETTNLTTLAADGLCTVAVKVPNGAEFYWWDADSLKEGSMEETSYKSLKTEGFIDLYGAGSIMSPVSNGPFALLLDFYEGDSKALEQAYRAVGQAE